MLINTFLHKNHETIWYSVICKEIKLNGGFFFNIDYIFESAVLMKSVF